MTERSGAGVRDAGHLEHPRHMRVATVALNSVGEVEHDARGPGLHRFRVQELGQLLEQRRVALEARHLFKALGQGLEHAVDRAPAVALGARPVAVKEDAVTRAVSNHGDALRADHPLTTRGRVAGRSWGPGLSEESRRQAQNRATNTSAAVSRSISSG